MDIAIIIIISLLFDGLLTNYLPFLVGDLSLFTPLLTLTTIFIIYPFFHKKENKYYIIAFVVGVVYDLFYTNLLFYNAILFLIIAVITKLLYKNFEISYLKLLLYIPLIITIYESIQALILLIFSIVPITFAKLEYKIVHSLLLNIIYGELLFFINNKFKKKRKISIN